LTEPDPMQFWQEKLKYLRTKEAAAADASEKFKLRKDIEEAERHLGRHDSRIGLRDDGSAASGVRWDACDDALLRRYFEICAKYDSFFAPHAQGNDDAVRQYLVASGLAIAVSEGYLELTDAGLLLCCRRDVLPRSRHHVDVKFQQKRSAADSENEEFWGSVLHLYFELLERLRPLFERRVGSPRERTESGSEKVLYEYPPTAIIEALVNFLIHRDYTADDLGRITVYPDRIQFSNPGMSLVPVERLLTADQPLEPKYLRNPRLIEAMNRARLNQREGGGILRIRTELESNGSLRTDGSLGLSIENDAERQRFVLTIYKRVHRLGEEATEPHVRAIGGADNPPERSLLPAPVRMIGREKERDELVRGLLAEPPARLAILGAGGMGKTTLALAALHDPRVIERFGARRWFVRCEGIRTRREVVAAVGAKVAPGISPDVEHVILHELDQAPALIVLDGLEDPWNADPPEVEEFLSILSGIDSASLIVTLRGHVRPRGVRWSAAIEADRLSENEARELFLAEAGTLFAGDPDLDLLLAELDGVPLAIVLMARYAQVYRSLEPVLNSWRKKRTSILRDGNREDRLTNISVSFDLSIGVLSPVAQRALSILALLPTGIDMSILSDFFEEAPDAAHELRRQALIFDDGQRMRMVAPLRAYVIDNYPPPQSGEARLTSLYLELLIREGSRIGGPGGADAVATLAPEAANLEAMLLRESSMKHEQIDQAVAVWSRFVQLTGLGSPFPIEERVRQAIAQNRMGEAGWELAELGNIALTRSDYKSAEEYFTRALTILHEVGATAPEAMSIANLGTIAAARGDHAAAAVRYSEALALYRKTGNMRGEANVILALGEIALASNNDAEAHLHFEQAVALYRKIGDRLGEANACRGLGDVMHLSREQGSARLHYEEALRAYRELGAVLNEAYVLVKLGDLARDANRDAEAVPYYESALSMFERMDDSLNVGQTHHRLAGVIHDDKARDAHRAAARAAFHRIGRHDLVEEIEGEF
jgi:tetratricopeptide (TPR) repeat protein